MPRWFVVAEALEKHASDRRIASHVIGGLGTVPRGTEF